MGKLGFTFHMDRCIGCKACQVACKDKNHLEAGTFFRRVDTVTDGGRPVHFSGACNHCENPACVAACPTGAMYLAPDGTVQHDDGKCIGCGSCVWACPYGAVSLSRQTGTAVKCNACEDLLKTGQQPACVQACITHCLEFGPIEPEQRQARTDFLPDPGITNPTLRIVTGKAGNK